MKNKNKNDNPSAAAVIGVSAMGAPALLLLLHYFLNIIRVVLVDHDSWKKGEQHKQILSSKKDIGKPKVLTERNIIHSYDPTIKVVTVKKKVQHPKATQAILTTDLWILGVDNDLTRLDLQILAAKHKKSFVDLSAQIIGKERVGTTRIYIPKKTPCIICQGLPLHNIMTKTLRKAKISTGYLKGTNTNPRSVAVLDTATAAMGISLLADHIEGRKNLPTTLSYNQTSHTITKVKFEKKHDCKICNQLEKETISCLK